MGATIYFNGFAMVTIVDPFQYHSAAVGIFLEDGTSLMVGYKFKKALLSCQAATSAALVFRCGSEDGLAVDDRPPCRSNLFWHVVEALRYISMLSEYHRMVFHLSSPLLLE